MIVVGFVVGGLIGWLLAQFYTSQRVARLEIELVRTNQAKIRADEAVAGETSRRVELETINNRLVSEMAGLATRPPHVIDPAPMIRAMGEAIASAYGSPSTVTETIPVEQRIMDYSKIAPAMTVVDDEQWFPDVEMDEWLKETQGGFPTKGGWVNRQTNSQVRLPDTQTPQHRVLANGELVRTDSQPMFRAGEGLQGSPPGGLE